MRLLFRSVEVHTLHGARHPEGKLLSQRQVGWAMLPLGIGPDQCKG